MEDLQIAVRDNLLIIIKMKKNLIINLIFFSLSNFYAQDLNTALMFSNGETLGTARFKSMSGAFGALGGDLSAVSINPAGSTIFNSSQGTLTAATNKSSYDVTYSNSKNINSLFNLDLSQIGAAFVFKNNYNSSPWNKFVISVFYERLDNYDSEFSIAGNTNKSISSYFMENANGLELVNISAFEGESISQAYSAIGSTFGYQNQQAFLGYNSYILDPAEEIDENTVYLSNIAPGNFYQQYDYQTNGNNGKLSANIAFQYNENINFGLNLNSHFIEFEKSTYLLEENNNDGSSINSVNFQNQLYTNGEGFSMQFGGLFKLSHSFRFGVSYSSPTWLTLREESTQYLATSSIIDDTSYIVNPSIVNIFPEYNLKTPGNIMGSFAYVHGKVAIISFDFESKNYANTSFDTGNNQLDILLNNSINNTFTTSNTYRLGAEFRNKNISYRAGFKSQESPYRNKNFYGDLSGYSFGLGYDFNNTRLDLSYENIKRSYSQELYQSGNLNSLRLQNNASIISLSLTMKL